MSGHFNVLSLDMEQTARLSISGENNTIQVGQRNFIICSDAPVDVGPDSDDGDDDEGEWTQVSQRQGQPGVPQVPNAVHSTPDLDISGSGHLVQTGKTCLQMPMDADPNQVSQIAAVRLPTGGGTFSPKVRIRGQNHDIQHGDVCIKVSSPTVPGQTPSPLSQASASANGAIPLAEPTTKGVEEEGSEESDWEQSQHVQHNVHLRPPPLSSLQADGRGEETDLKTTSAPQPSLPHQESATGAQGQGDNPTKWQLLAAEERAIEGAEPQIPAKIVGDRAEQPDVAVPALGQQRVIDLKGNITCLSGRAVPTEDEISNLTSPEPIVFDSRSQPTSNTVFNTTSTSSITPQVESTSSIPELSHGGDNDISNVSLNSTLKAAAAEPVDKSPSLSQSQGSDRSTGSLSTRTLTSSGINQRGERARSVDPQPSRDDEISNDSHSDVDVECSVKEADVFTSAVAPKTSASLKESQQDCTTTGKLDDGGSRKGEKSRSPVPVEPTMAKKSSYDRSHSLDTQLTDAGGLAEHHLGSFYSSQTAAAAELRSGFTDNEISNDAIYEIQTDSVPEKTKSPSPERQRKWHIAKPSIVTAVNASVLSSGSQHVEIREQSMEDMTQHQHWGHQLSDDDDIMEDKDYDIENPGISMAPSRHSPPLLLGIDSHFRSLDVLKSQSALPSLSARPSLQASLVERVNRMEQVLDDVKRMKSEGQQNLESRMDRLEGMVEKVLQMMTTQTNNTPTTPNGFAPSSLQGVAHYGASGGEGPSHREQASESAEDSPNDETAKPDFYEQKGGYPKTGLEEELPSYRQYGKAGKTRNVSFLSPENVLEPLRTMRSFKGDASVRPKERPSTSWHHEEGDRGRRGTKGAYKGTATGKKGVPAGTRDAYGDTKAARGHEGGTTGHDGGIRVYAGGLRQDSGGRDGIETEFEGDQLEVTTSPKKPARKEFSRPLRPQFPPLDEEAVEEDSIVVSEKTSHAFGRHTLMILENLMLVSSRSEVTSDPVAFRLATAVERAIYSDIKPMPPRATGQCTVLVLDNSESMKGRPLQQAIKFANDFLDGIEDIAEKYIREENIAIVTIGGGAKVVHHFSNDYNSLRSALEGVRAEGRSPVMEAMLISFALVYTQNTVMIVGKTLPIPPRVIFVTDGKITDKSQTRGPDTLASTPKARAELIQVMQYMQTAPTFPRPVVWVPVRGADRAFMDAMAGTPGSMVSELDEIEYLTHYYRLQIITGQVLGFILQMPEGPVHLGECIRSHIEVFQPNLREDFKKIVFTSVVKSISNRHITTLAHKKMAGEKRAAEERTGEKRAVEKRTGEKRAKEERHCGHCHACLAAKEGHTSTHPSKAQRKVAR